MLLWKLSQAKWVVGPSLSSLLTSKYLTNKEIQY